MSFTNEEQSSTLRAEITSAPEGTLSASVERAGSVFIIVLVAMCSPLGYRFPLMVQNLSMVCAAGVAILMTLLAWWRVWRMFRDENAFGWREWVSLVGCAGLSAAIAIPICVAGFGLSWVAMSRWCLGAGVTAMLAGIVVGGGMRFPLFFGGLIVGSLVMFLPAGGF